MVIALVYRVRSEARDAKPSESRIQQKAPIQNRLFYPPKPRLDTCPIHRPKYG